MNKQDKETQAVATIILSVIFLPLLFLLGIALGAWQGYWLSRILTEMHAAYGWPTFSITQCMVAAIVMGILSKSSHKKCDIDWGAWGASLLMPMVSYWAVLFILWFNR